MFALPFVFYETGFLTGVLYLIIFSIVFATVHFMYSEVILHTESEHRFIGYAEIYLGKFGKWTAVLTTFLGLIITLAIYIILSASFIKLIIPDLSPFTAGISFWLLGSIVIVLSLHRLANFEFLVTLAIIAIILILFVLGLGHIGIELPLAPKNFSLPTFILPYGIVLFSLGGRAAISSVREYFKKNNIDVKNLGKATIFGSVAPAVIYVFFVLAITWLSPGGVSEDAVSGVMFVAPIILCLIGILGFFALWTSYFFLGLEVRDILRYDFKISLPIALVMVVSFPLLIYFSDSQNFIWFMSIVGGIFLAAESIIVVLMRRKIKPINWWGYFIIIVFVLGAVYEVLKLV